ncbi:MAG: hypothetical protein ACLFP1_08795 [Candidatus Goldiibacteriota bacterium]
MKKFSLLFFAAAAIFAACGGGNEGPLNPAPTPVPGIISGNLLLPEPLEGRHFKVIVDTDLHIEENAAEYTGVCGAGVSIPYSVTITPGNYYIYTFINEDGDYSNPPVQGDYIGIYGGDWPSLIPESANLLLEEGEEIQADDIAMAQAYNNMTGTVTIPEPAQGHEYIIMLDAGPQMGEGISGIARGFISEAGSAFDYELLFPFPGDYAVYGFVDITGSGIENGFEKGDYGGGDGEKIISGMIFYTKNRDPGQENTQDFIMEEINF